MKNLYLVFLGALLLTSVRAGVIAHYSFDADYSDQSGFSRHGTLVDNGELGNSVIDTAPNSSVFGGGSLFLSNDRDYISFPEITLGTTEGYTIAFWARRSATSKALCIVAGNTTNTKDFIGIFTDGRGFRWRNSSGQTTDIGWAPNDTAWHHYTIVVTADDLTLYVDGIGGQPVSISNMLLSINAIGEGYASSGYDFDGNLDEFWILDEPLSASSVQVLYEDNTIEVVSEPMEEITRLLVILQGGQSNADGRAGKGSLPTEPVNLQMPQTDVDVFHKREGESYLGSLAVLQPGLNRKSDDFGPEITMGRSYADLYKNDSSVRVAIIKYARGGTHLAGDWVAGGDASTFGDGPEYQVFQTTVADGLAALAEAYPSASIEVQAMVWMQGESDANRTSWAERYEDNLRTFIEDVRLTFGQNLPFIIGRLSVGQTALDHEELVRAAQDVVAEENPWTGIIDTDDLTLQSDNIHFDADGQMGLGRRFAEAVAYYAWMVDAFSEQEIVDGRAEPEGDFDADGQSNRFEFTAGSDPRSGTSRFQFNIHLEKTPVAEIRLGLYAMANRVYSFEQYNESEKRWELISDMLFGSDALLTFTADDFEGRGLYRAKINLP